MITILTKRVILCVLVLTGCSSVREISSSNQNIQENATKSKEGFEYIHEETGGTEVPNVTQIHQVSAQGILEQTNILKETKDIVQATTGVKDITPWWSELIVYVMMGLSILGVVFCLWYLGVGYLTKGLFAWLGSIPQKKTEQAQLFLEALDTNNKTSIQEAIAVLRANDKSLNRAFLKEKAVRNARKQSNPNS